MNAKRQEPSDMELEPGELEALEARLLELRARVLKDLGHFDKNYTWTTMQAASGELSAYTFHMADRGTDAMEREQAFLLASKEGRVLLEIDGALRKIYSGERFGRCEECGGAIGKERLKVLPQARLCLSCQRAIEHRTRA